MPSLCQILGHMRYGQAECEHGTPGGGPDTCALCRVRAARLAEQLARVDRLEQWGDPRMLAAADR